MERNGASEVTTVWRFINQFININKKSLSQRFFCRCMCEFLWNVANTGDHQAAVVAAEIPVLTAFTDVGRVCRTTATNVYPLLFLGAGDDRNHIMMCVFVLAQCHYVCLCVVNNFCPVSFFHCSSRPRILHSTET